MIKVLHTGPFGVNTLVVPLTENKVFVVDPACCELCGDEKTVSSYLAQNNLECAAFVLTHGHFDHVSGLSFLHKLYPQVPVLISREDKNMIGSDSAVVQGRMLSLMGFMDFLPAVSNLPEPSGFLENGKTLADACQKNSLPGVNISEEERLLTEALNNWRILSTPGHTSGSVCLVNDKEKVLISGDTLFYGSWGRTDLGGSEEQIRKSLIMLKETIPADYSVYPGHEMYGFKMGDNF